MSCSKNGSKKELNVTLRKENVERSIKMDKPMMMYKLGYSRVFFKKKHLLID